MAILPFLSRLVSNVGDLSSGRWAIAPLPVGVLGLSGVAGRMLREEEPRGLSPAAKGDRAWRA
jgi:hypothetical protein